MYLISPFTLDDHRSLELVSHSFVFLMLILPFDRVSNNKKVMQTQILHDIISSDLHERNHLENGMLKSYKEKLDNNRY